MKTPKPFLGTWRVTETEMWGKDALDLVVPAHITFEADGLGTVQKKRADFDEPLRALGVVELAAVA